jgi:hypothetical protein
MPLSDSLEDEFNLNDILSPLPSPTRSSIHRRTYDELELEDHIAEGINTVNAPSENIITAVQQFAHIKCLKTDQVIEL